MGEGVGCGTGVVVGAGIGLTVGANDTRTGVSSATCPGSDACVGPWLRITVSSVTLTDVCVGLDVAARPQPTDATRIATATDFMEIGQLNLQGQKCVKKRLPIKFEFHSIDKIRIF